MSILMHNYQHKTINTFTQGPHIAQIACYLVVIAQIVLFYVCINPLLQKQAASLAFGITYPVTLGLVVISTLVCSIIDPSDPVIREYRQVKVSGKDWSPTGYNYCYSCESYCEKSAKHCKKCSRCVIDFDHHCIWINNCIGSTNYRWFICMIVMTALNLIAFSAAGLYMLHAQGWTSISACSILVWIETILNIVFLVMDLHLIGFHIFLKCKGVSTFEFMMMRQKEQFELRDRKPKVAPKQVTKKAEESEQHSAAKLNPLQQDSSPVKYTFSKTRTRVFEVYSPDTEPPKSQNMPANNSKRRLAPLKNFSLSPERKNHKIKNLDEIDQGKS